MIVKDKSFGKYSLEMVNSNQFRVIKDNGDSYKGFKGELTDCLKFIIGRRIEEEGEGKTFTLYELNMFQRKIGEDVQNAFNYELGVSVPEQKEVGVNE